MYFLTRITIFLAVIGGGDVPLVTILPNNYKCTANPYISKVVAIA
jgi:hypothetical protein